MASKKTFSYGDMTDDPKIVSLIELMAKESIEAWREWAKMDESYIRNHPLIQMAGKNPDFTYKTISYDNEIVGFFGWYIDNPVPVLNVEEFYIEEKFQTPSKMKEVVSYLKSLCMEQGCIRVKLDIYHTTKRASLMSKLGMKPFITTYGTEV